MQRTAAEEAYWNLVAAARAEDGITAEEQKVLNAYVIKLGLDPRQAKEIQVLATAENPPRLRIPKDLEGRRQTLRSVLEVVAADGRIAPKELAAVKALAGRLSLSARDVDGLVKAALKGSGAKLDRAFAALSMSARESAESVEFEGPAREEARRGEGLRALPFAARLAPAVRTCTTCELPFAAKDRYEQYCRPCRRNHLGKGFTRSRCEALVAILFVLFLWPAGRLVERGTGLWSWGQDAAVRASESASFLSPKRRRRKADEIAVYYAPATFLTAALAGISAWGFGALVLACSRRKSAVCSRDMRPRAD